MRQRNSPTVPEEIPHGFPAPRTSFLPAFASWLSGQPEPHHAGHFLWAPLSFAVVEVVQDQVVPGGCQQTQVGLRVMVGLLLSAAVPFPCHLLEG